MSQANEMNRCALDRGGGVVFRVQETAKLRSGGDRAECAQDSVANTGWQEEFGGRKEVRLKSKRQVLGTRYNELRGSDFTLKAREAPK